MDELRRPTGVRRFRSWRADRPTATVVVLHGLGEHSGLYERFASALVAAGVSVHVADLAGHGASEGPRGIVTSFDDLVDDAAELVARVEDGTPLSIVGHCIGSIVATLLVARDPGRYRSLVLTGPLVEPDVLLRSLGTMDDDALQLGSTPDLSALSTDPWYRDRCAADPVVWEAGFTRTTLDALDRAWAEVEVARPRLTLPVLAVLGDRDYFMAPATLRRWVDALPDGSLSVVPGSCHAVLNDRDHAMVAAMIVDVVAPPARIAAVPAGPPPEPARRPDIVLIMTDEQRHDWVGHAGDGSFETPVLDRLAASGVIFEQACSAATTCVPARTALLTGLHFPNAPRVDGGFALREGFWTIARELRDAGYETALIGRMHFVPIHADHGFETMRMCENINPGSGYTDADDDDYKRFLAEQGRPDWRVLSPNPGGEPRPFDVAHPRVFPDDASLHSTSWIEREATTFLQERDGSRPLFLIVSFPHPHAPYDPPEPYASRYSPADAVLPRDGYEANAVLHGSFRTDLEAPWTHRVSASGGIEVLRSVLTAIRGLVRQIDDAVGSIVEELDLDDSLIFFTSDHGDYGGNRGLFTKVPWIPFDDLLRVPLVVAGGAVGRTGHRSPALVQSASFAATCLDYAGIPAPEGTFDFPSLRPLLDADPAPGTPEPDLGPVISFSYSYPTIRAGAFKLITTQNSDDLLLFDLEQDPRELVDRSTDPACAAVIDELHTRLRYEARTPRRSRHPIEATRTADATRT